MKCQHRVGVCYTARAFLCANMVFEKVDFFWPLEADLRFFDRPVGVLRAAHVRGVHGQTPATSPPLFFCPFLARTGWNSHGGAGI